MGWSIPGTDGWFASAVAGLEVAPVEGRELALPATGEEDEVRLVMGQLSDENH
jgi:hypothetical protein